MPVQTIHANKKAAGAESAPRVLRAAAYARVSTDNVEQKTSYDAQISEYTERIAKNPGCELVDIYADERYILGPGQKVLAVQGFTDLVLIFRPSTGGTTLGR